MGGPPLWRVLGRWRIYALSSALTFSVVASAAWITVQLHVSRSDQLTPAATAFFAGFELVMVIVVLMTTAAAISAEDATMRASLVLMREIKTLHDDVAKLLRQGENDAP